MNKTLLLAGTLVAVTIFGVAFTMQPKEDENAMKEAFMNNCTIDSSYQSYCECSYKKVRSNYSLKQLQAINDRMTSGNEIPNEIVSIAYSCMDEL